MGGSGLKGKGCKEFQRHRHCCSKRDALCVSRLGCTDQRPCPRLAVVILSIYIWPDSPLGSRLIYMQQRSRGLLSFLKKKRGKNICITQSDLAQLERVSCGVWPRRIGCSMLIRVKKEGEGEVFLPGLQSYATALTSGRWLCPTHIKEPFLSSSSSSRLIRHRRAMAAACCCPQSFFSGLEL